MKNRLIIKWCLVSLIVISITGYSYFILYDIIRGPYIIISSPKNNFGVTTPLITLSGQAIRTNNLTINDVPTTFDRMGHFSKQLILAKGYNKITLTVSDRYKRAKEKIIEINLLN